MTTETSPSADGADARVAELNQAVAELTAALTAARRELETLRVAHADLRRVHDDMRSSRAFKLAERIWAVRGALRRGRRR